MKLMNPAVVAAPIDSAPPCFVGTAGPGFHSLGVYLALARRAFKAKTSACFARIFLGKRVKKG